MPSLVPISELSAHPPEKGSYVVFGGSFDPLHHGHVNAVRQLLKHFKRVIIAATDQNPWKDDAATDISIRRKMIRSVLAYECLPRAESEADAGVSVSCISYQFAETLVHHYRAALQGSLYWAVGEDISDSIYKWRNWSELNVPAVIVSIEIPMHSEEVRNGAANVHPGAVGIASKHKLYGL